MIAENQEEGAVAQIQTPLWRTIPWFRLLLSLFLGGLGLWFVFRDTSLAALGAVLSQTRPGYLLLALASIVLTGLVKSWRWQLLFRDHPPVPSFAALFWSLHLGQLFNTLVPFFRVNEIVRIVDLDRRTRVGKARILGTLVVEKMLEMITLALLVFLLIPFLVLPDYARESRLALAITGLMAFAALWIMAYQTERIAHVLRQIAGRFSHRYIHRLLPIFISGLEGLAALRSRKTILQLLLSSLFIGLLYILTPIILFGALDLQLGLVEGAAVHAVLAIGTVPSWAPANVGVFEFLTAATLRYFGLTDSSVILAYTLLFHLVIVLPQVILGGLAALQSEKLPDARNLMSENL